MTLIEKIEETRQLIRALSVQINICTPTAAGYELKREFQNDRDELYYQLGKLIANSAVIICLR